MIVMRVAVIDDDYWRREAMVRALLSDERFEVSNIGGHDEVPPAGDDRWESIDLAVVEIYDEQAPAETGTDVFSGISALDRLDEIRRARGLALKTVAITMHCQHPLIQLRLFETSVDWVYHRWEVNSPESLADALLNPSAEHRPIRPDDRVLEQFGAVGVDANEVVRLYERSVLAGRLTTQTGYKHLGIPRSVLDRFRSSVAELGFNGTEDRGGGARRVRAPRFPDVRAFVLTLLGRSGNPPTEVDREDDDRPHGEWG